MKVGGVEVAIRLNRFVNAETGDALVVWYSSVLNWKATVLVADHEGVVFQAGGKRWDVPTSGFLRNWVPVTSDD